MVVYVCHLEIKSNKAFDLFSGVFWELHTETVYSQCAILICKALLRTLDYCYGLVVELCVAVCYVYKYKYEIFEASIWSI